MLTIPEVVDFHRIGGDYDYLLKVVTEDMASYDRVYQRLIEKVELDSVTSYFAMEAIADGRPCPCKSRYCFLVPAGNACVQPWGVASNPTASAHSAGSGPSSISIKQISALR